jgi:hypothetical protein
MNSPNESALHDVAILTRAVENVFRKLIRLLIGKMSLKKLQELIQIIFIEEAEAKLKLEAPGKNVALSKLGAVTDLDTRALTRIRSTQKPNVPIHMDIDFLKGFTPGFKVLDLWINDEKYLDKQSKKPIALSFSGECLSFEKLVNEAISARGVTARSMLARLKENNFIKIDAITNQITLVRENYIFLSNNELGMIDIGFSAIANLANTVSHNIKNADSKNSRLYQRGCWTYRLNKKEQKDFQNAMFNFLNDVDKKAKDAILPYEEKKNGPDQITAGISMFYFESEHQNQF